MQKFVGKSLVMFGDSIMYGSGNGGVGVGEYLAKDMGFTLTKYCRGGSRVGYQEGKNWVVDQIYKAVEAKVKADYIVFDGFTNDCNKMDGIHYNVPLGEMTEGFDGFDVFAIKKDGDATFSYCFECIAAAFKKYFPQAKILFVRPHVMGSRDEVMQRVYGERALEICKKWGIAVVDIYKDADLNTFREDHRDLYTADTGKCGQGDGTHPNDLCYREKYMPLIEREIEKL